MKRQSQPQVKSSAAQGMVEYVLIVVLIALFLIAVFTLLSGGMSNVLNDLIEFL